MVKLTVTIATAVIAAAVLADTISSVAGSPLSQRGGRFRDDSSTDSDGSDDSWHSSHDFSRDHDWKPHGGHHGHHHRPTGSGNLDMAYDGSDKDVGGWHGKGSFDGRFPPPDAGNDKPMGPPQGEPGPGPTRGDNLRGAVSDDHRLLSEHHHGASDDHHWGDKDPGSWHGSGSIDGHHRPAGHDVFPDRDQDKGRPKHLDNETSTDHDAPSGVGIDSSSAEKPQ